MHYTVKHIIEADVATFWKVFFDPEYNRAFAEDWRDQMRVELAESQADADGVLHRKVNYSLRTPLPAPARKFMGDGSFTEIGRFDPAAGRYAAQWTPIGPETFRTALEIWAEPLTSHRCERVTKVDGVVRVGGFGALLEGLVAKSQRDAFARMADFMNRWIASRPS